ncbi:YafY family protein [Algibacter sp. L4_22]|uniref:helix-turn-helix transcriptional regulator n=1 Tax=Algibacter sp. L4_22 TaxID=2942477 RepID=UPI00201B8E0C|nr:WYL domain-containing protein [Algibacter sp. L4_22]MCL5128362.1 WYL domain-containing protein [Algibacter sp. L4_22]
MTPDFIRKFHIYEILTKTSINNCKSRQEIINTLETLYLDYHDGDKLYQGLLVSNEKTISRDVKDIESFFGVEIEHIRHKGHYMVNQSVITKTHRTVFDKMELFLASHKERQWSPYITTEESSLNTEINILGLVKAIARKVYIKINYEGWYDDDHFSEIKQATVQPLHIKEANKAWYLLVYNEDIGVKVLCLDKRISNILITDHLVEDPYYFDKLIYFKDAFGILKNDIKTETIRIKVANHHFKYLESKPLHHSQTIISRPVKMNTDILDYTDKNIFGEISVTLKPNYEFLIELFKFNLWVKVIEPQWLIETIVEQHKFILQRYYPDI